MKLGSLLILAGFTPSADVFTSLCSDNERFLLFLVADSEDENKVLLGELHQIKLKKFTGSTFQLAERFPAKPPTNHCHGFSLQTVHFLVPVHR